MSNPFLKLARAILPRNVRRGLTKLTRRPVLGQVCLGDLRRVKPISVRFGFDRGQPIDRYYIEGFLSEHADAIKGTVLEIGQALYTHRFGGDRVDQLEVLDVAEWRPGVTVVGDLTDSALFPENTFDCIVLTQTLQFIYDVGAAVANCRRFLKPGGIVLATVSGISQVSTEDKEPWGHYWSFTTLSASRLFRRAFPGGELAVVAYGNVLSSIAFLHGLASRELRPEELDAFDPNYQVIIGVRAVKGVGSNV